MVRCFRHRDGFEDEIDFVYACGESLLIRYKDRGKQDELPLGWTLGDSDFYVAEGLWIEFELPESEVLGG